MRIIIEEVCELNNNSLKIEIDGDGDIRFSVIERNGKEGVFIAQKRWDIIKRAVHDAHAHIESANQIGKIQ